VARAHGAAIAAGDQEGDAITFAKVRHRLARSPDIQRLIDIPGDRHGAPFGRIRTARQTGGGLTGQIIECWLGMEVETAINDDEPGVTPMRPTRSQPIVDMCAVRRSSPPYFP